MIRIKRNGEKTVITIIIADDHALVTDSLRIVLENDSNIRVLATAYDGKEALERCKELKPDIVFAGH